MKGSMNFKFNTMEKVLNNNRKDKFSALKMFPTAKSLKRKFYLNALM